uniref:Er-6 pheromone n=1 Tax=Euplotes raikovi TaxID=5938 RepID=A0A346CI63_EUPRA|nr:Er-6 pheromone [Euplotes raikovi]
MNKLAILAIIAMVLFSANAFRFQSRFRSNVKTMVECNGDPCCEAGEQCSESGCHALCPPEDVLGCVLHTTREECQ